MPQNEARHSWNPVLELSCEWQWVNCLIQSTAVPSATQACGLVYTVSLPLAGDADTPPSALRVPFPQEDRDCPPRTSVMALRKDEAQDGAQGPAALPWATRLQRSKGHHHGGFAMKHGDRRPDGTGPPIRPGSCHPELTSSSVKWVRAPSALGWPQDSPPHAWSDPQGWQTTTHTRVRNSTDRAVCFLIRPQQLCTKTQRSHTARAF